MTAHRGAREDQGRRLGGAIAISLAILMIELLAGIAANSLALLADAAHVFADVSGMTFSLGAIWLARRPSSAGRSFGLYRMEILAAVANALLLLAMSLLVIGEGLRRLADPEGVASGLVVVVAAIALLANFGSLALLSRGREHNLNLRGAYLEVLGDLIGALTVLVAGAVVFLTGFTRADAIASILIGLLILPRTWSLLREGVDVLLEATPKGVDMSEVRRHILEAPGVADVHDLHAWTITSGMNVVSAHVVLRDDANPGAILDHLGDCLSDDFDIDHSTFQLETPEHVVWEGRGARVRHEP